MSTRSEDREAPESAPVDAGALRRPGRALLAAAEVVLAAVAVWLAFVLWADGVTTLTAETAGGQVEMTRYQGNMIAGAIGLGGVAALLLLDAVRELMLALRTRTKPERPAEAQWPSDDEDRA